MNIGRKLPAEFPSKTRALFILLLCAVLIFQSTAASAFETDQYNLPPKPLADIGDEVAQYAEENLRKAIDKINVEIRELELCAANDSGRPEKIKCGSAENQRAKLQFLRSEAAITRAVYNQLGAGTIPFTKSGSWMESHVFSVQPARYKTDYKTSIFFIIPTNYLTISRTVKIYGAQFGTDKIAHFFQQGYTYYKKYNDAIAEGLTPDEAAKRAIRWGRMTERTFYGTLVSGVYSNADLCANYVGMKFYQNLTRPAAIGNHTKPAVFILENGIWKFGENAGTRENLIKPFLTEHLNEALNPSIFIVGLRSYARRTVKKRSCEQWLETYPNLSQADYARQSEFLKLWNGEDYGFTDSKHFITIANTCFDGKKHISDKSG